MGRIDPNSRTERSRSFSTDTLASVRVRNFVAVVPIQACPRLPGNSGLLKRHQRRLGGKSCKLAVSRIETRAIDNIAARSLKRKLVKVTVDVNSKLIDYCPTENSLNSGARAPIIKQANAGKFCGRQISNSRSKCCARRRRCCERRIQKDRTRVDQGRDESDLPREADGLGLQPAHGLPKKAIWLEFCEVPAVPPGWN